MHFSALLASASLFWTATAAPASTSYSLVTTHSGDTDVHLRPIGFTPNGEVAIGAANPLTAFFDGDKLGVTGAHGEHGAQVYFHINDDNSVVINDFGTDGFSLQNTDIAFDGKQEFGVCVDNGQLYIKEAPSCSKFVGVGVYAAPVDN